LEVLQKPDGIVAGSENSGLGPGGILAQTDRAAVAVPPVLVDQAVEEVRGGASDFFKRSAVRLDDQFQSGQVTHRR